MKMFTNVWSFAKLRCRYQPFRANSMISYTVGNWHASPPLRRKTVATEPSFLVAATTSGWRHYCLQDIQGPFGYWSELVLPPSRSTRPKESPLQGTPRCEPRRRRGLAFSVRVMKHWSKLPASAVTAHSVNVFKKRLEKVWTEVLPHPSHWLITQPPPPLPTCASHIGSYHLYMFISSLLYICGFFRPIVAYFLPL